MNAAHDCATLQSMTRAFHGCSRPGHCHSLGYVLKIGCWSSLGWFLRPCGGLHMLYSCFIRFLLGSQQLWQIPTWHLLLALLWASCKFGICCKSNLCSVAVSCLQACVDQKSRSLLRCIIPMLRGMNRQPIMPITSKDMHSQTRTEQHCISGIGHCIQPGMQGQLRKDIIGGETEL